MSGRLDDSSGCNGRVPYHRRIRECRRVPGWRCSGARTDGDEMIARVRVETKHRFLMMRILASVLAAVPDIKDRHRVLLTSRDMGIT